METEEWRDIEGAFGYQVSNLGNVRSFWNMKKQEFCLNETPKNLKNSMAKVGYFFVNIRINGLLQPRYVHRLVAQAFIQNPENKPQVAHNDGTRTNNHFSNLKWATQKENEKDKLIHGTGNKTILTPEFVRIIRDTYVPHKNTASMIAKKLCIPVIAVRNVIHNPSHYCWE